MLTFLNVLGGMRSLICTSTMNQEFTSFQKSKFKKIKNIALN